jgi:hypothetical protein
LQIGLDAGEQVSSRVTTIKYSETTSIHFYRYKSAQAEVQVEIRGSGMQSDSELSSSHPAPLDRLSTFGYLD